MFIPVHEVRSINMLHPLSEIVLFAQRYMFYKIEDIFLYTLLNIQIIHFL